MAGEVRKSPTQRVPPSGHTKMSSSAKLERTSSLGQTDHCAGSKVSLQTSSGSLIYSSNQLCTKPLEELSHEKVAASTADPTSVPSNSDESALIVKVKTRNLFLWVRLGKHLTTHMFCIILAYLKTSPRPMVFHLLVFCHIFDGSLRVCTVSGIS